MEITVLVISIIFTFNHVLTNRVPIKVVQEPASYGFYGSNLMQGDSSDQLTTTVKPSNFSGPSHFKALVGKCFNLTDDQYRYVLCPFSNITQHELALRWNAYQGILGVWQEWEILNNTFSAMLYGKGTLCGDLERSTKVAFECGIKNELINVTEPKRCHYAAVFMTPLVCHRDAMLVYPRTSSYLRDEWDKLETELALGYITQKGYDVELKKIFQKAGFLLTPEKKKSPVVTTTTPAAVVYKPFNNLDQCNTAYQELGKEISDLRQEIESLKVLLDLNKVIGKTDKG